MDLSATTQEVKLEIPRLADVAKALRARDDAASEIAWIQDSTESLINDLTMDLQVQIKEIRAQEEARIAASIRRLKEERDIADDMYRTLLGRCVTANVMEEGRYHIVNKTRVDHPINPRLFKEKFPDVFEKIATIKKTDAESAIKEVRGVKSAVAKAIVKDFCDDVPSGAPQWELEVRKVQGAE